MSTAVHRGNASDAGTRILEITAALADLAMMAQELASGSMFPKVAHHVPTKTSARFVNWL